MNIDTLKDYPQWVCYQYPDKMPINPHTGYGAKCNDPATWSTYDFARLTKRESHYDGIGYEFCKEQGITGIDLDKCIDEQGNITPWARAIVERLDSYTEFSPSGRGLHIWVHGSIPDNIDSNKADGENAIEMYDCQRYFTITGLHLSGTPETFEDRQIVLLTIYQETVARRAKAKRQTTTVPQQRRVESTGDTPYGLKALGDESRELANCPNGSRNAQLNRAAFASGRLVAGNELTRMTAEQALTDAALACGLGDSEIEKTLRSGIEKGMQSPRSAPEEGKSVDLCSFHPDDSGNGDAVYAVYGHSFLYCAAYGWLSYTGTHWKRMSDDSAIKQAAVKVLRNRRLAAVKADKEFVVKCTLASAKNVNGAIDRFKSLVSVPVEVFDNELDFFNAQNGVVDLRNGSLLPHSSLQRFTWCAPVPYAPGDATLWLSQLKETVGGGQEMIDYLQLALGYSLTGHTSEECLFYSYGPSRSGKGTIAETMQALFPSPLAESIDFTSLTAKRAEDTNNFDLARLKPSRMVFASESNRSQPLNTAKIKSITGGDNITASHKHRDAFTYRPQFKLWMLSNWPVNGDPEDDALWGRVRVIEFPHSFQGKEDKSRKARLKRPASLQAILYWSVQGSIEWYALGAQGLSIPKKVAATTKKQRDELDFIAQWLAECTEPGEWISNEEVKTSYTGWCEDNNVTPKKARNFALSLQMKGYETGVQKKVDGKNHKGIAGLQPKTMNSDNDESNGLVTVTDETDRNEKIPEYAYIGNISEAPVSSVTVTDATLNSRPLPPLPELNTKENSEGPFTQKLTSDIEKLLCDFKTKHVKKAEVFWTAPKTGIANGYLTPKAWYEQFMQCYNSADSQVREAALEALKAKVQA